MMNQPLKFLALVFSILSLQAQGNLDSLLTIAESDRDTVWLDNLVTASWDHMYSDPRRVLNVLSDATELASEKGYESKLPRLYVNCGIAYDVMDVPDSAMYLYRQGLALAESLNDTLMMASSYNNMGLIEWNLNRLDTALIYYIKSEELFEAISNERGLNSTMNNIGLIYLDQERNEDARRYFRKVLNQSLESESKYFESVAYQNLGLTFNTELIEDMDSAIYFTELAIPIQKEINNQYGLAKSYHSMVDMYNTREEYEKSIDYENLAIEINRNLENYHALASNFYQLTYSYRQVNNTEMASASIDSAMVYVERISDPDLIQKVYEAKIDQELMVSRTDLYSLHLRSNQLLDSIYVDNINGKILDLQEEYEAEKKNKQIEVQALELERQDLQMRNQIILGIAGLVLIIGLIIWLIKRFRYKQQIAALEYQNRIQSERDRISKDLHDSVGAQLTSIATRIDLIGTKGSEETKPGLDKVSYEARETIQLLRDTIWALKSEDFTYADFYERIETYAREHLRGIAELKTLELKEGDEKLSSAHALNLFRIVQEAIQNIIKHSQAKTVEIEFGYNGERSVLAVSDDGVGSEEQNLEKEDHYGLENLRSRVNELKGRLNIKTQPNKGFRIEVVW